MHSVPLVLYYRIYYTRECIVCVVTGSPWRLVSPGHGLCVRAGDADVVLWYQPQAAKRPEKRSRTRRTKPTCHMHEHALFIHPSPAPIHPLHPRHRTCSTGNPSTAAMSTPPPSTASACCFAPLATPSTKPTASASFTRPRCTAPPSHWSTLCGAWAPSPSSS